MSFKKAIHTVGILFLSYASSGQELQIMGGYFSFGMSDMKAIQTESLNMSSIELREVEEFSPQRALELQLSLKDQNLEAVRMTLGMLLNSTATGGRLSYADFSGSYIVDQGLSRIATGPFVEVRSTPDAFFIGANAAIMGSFSSLNFESELNIGNDRQREEVSFSSIGVNLRLLAVLGYDVTQWGYLIGKMGYQVDVYESKLTFSENANAYLLTPEGGDAKSGWSGFRILFGVGIKL